jgi:2'-5' RNA ligase
MEKGGGSSDDEVAPPTPRAVAPAAGVKGLPPPPPPTQLVAKAVEWRGVGTFPSSRHPRALWLGVVAGGAQLGELEAEVSRRLMGTTDPEARPLLPHLTLGRIKMTGAGVDWPKVLQAVDVRGARSVVDRVTLYRSELAHRGPHYTGLVSAALNLD